MKNVNENKLIKWMTFITSMGDHFTFFSVVILTQQLFKNVWLSSYNVAIQALAIALGCFLVPKTLSRFKVRNIFFCTQFISMLAVLFLFFGIKNGTIHSPITLYSVLFIVTVLWQIYTAARESFSKNQTNHVSEHRTLQAEILEGFFSAQIFGPPLAAFLILKFNSTLPLLIDGISFGICALLSLFVRSEIKLERKASLLKPLKYFSEKPLLKKIFLLRTVGFWVPISIFNLVLFPMAEEQFKNILSQGNELLGTAIFYSLLGFGATVGTLSVRKGLFKSSFLDDGKLAFYCQIMMGTTMLLLIPNFNFFLNQLIFFINGTFMGINALATQTIRRKLATNEEFVEVIALEPIFGRSIDYAVASICILMPRSWWPIQLTAASCWLFVLARKHLAFDQNNHHAKKNL